MDLIILSSKDREELVKRLQDAENYKSTHEKMAIVIDGFTLTIVLDEDSLHSGSLCLVARLTQLFAAEYLQSRSLM